MKLEDRVKELEQENKELRKETRRLKSVINAGYEIDTELAKNPHYEDAILERIVKEAKKLLKVKKCAILLIDEKDRILRTRQASGLPKIWDEFEIKMGESISGKVAETGISDVVYDRLNDPRTKYNSVGRNVRAMASVPINNRKETLGVINVYKNNPHKFNKNDIKYLSILASKSAIAIEMARLHKEIFDAYISIPEDAVALVETKSKYTFKHSYNVTLLTQCVVEEMDIDEVDKENILYAAKLHDIGKIAVHDNILQKRKGLTENEWHQMKTHPFRGKALIERSHIPNAKIIAEDIGYHHENLDGSGYLKKKADEIPLGAKIIRIVDSFEAMTSGTRPWKKGMTPEEALKDLEKYLGTRYDNKVYKVFKAAFDKTDGFRTVLDYKHPPSTK